MSKPLTTEKHEPAKLELTATSTPVLLLAFPEARVIPLPALGAITGRGYFAEHGRIDGKISGEHFRLSRAGAVLRIEDLGSSNGTWINAHRLPARQPAPLSDGDVVRLGKSLFVYRDAFEGALSADPATDGLVGPFGLRAVRASVGRLRERRATTVLIEGETGSGKELVARAAAGALGRAKGLAPVNMAALAPGTLEGHLFGWERGAFSGADRTNKGLIREHDGGAVFLDEIGELPIGLQAKLLRVLENREVLSVGGHKPSRVDVVFIAATNQDLPRLVAEGKFRADLMARFLERIALPPLRDRPEDLWPLIRSLWERRYDPVRFDEARMEVEAMEALLLHDWPANARDADRCAAAVLGPSFELRLASVNAWLGPAARASRPAPLTREAVANALAEHGGNQSKAALALGVERGVVLRMLEKHPELKASAARKK